MEVTKAIPFGLKTCMYIDYDSCVRVSNSGEAEFQQSAAGVCQWCSLNLRATDQSSFEVIAKCIVSYQDCEIKNYAKSVPIS